MGAVASLCVSSKNKNAINNENELPAIINNLNDLSTIIPNLLCIQQSEFKRIFKQSKKPKYTKKLHDIDHNINDNNNNKQDDEEVKLELIDLPSSVLNDIDTFILKSKSLINSASVLSLVIIKDIIFKIQIIPYHRYMHQYNNYYSDQIKQRFVDIEELIMIHHGFIHCLYTTITILLHIGYKPQWNYNDNEKNKKLVLSYEDLSYLDQIKFHISLKEKLRLNSIDYEQYKLEDKRYILYEKLSHDIDEEKYDDLQIKRSIDIDNEHTGFDVDNVYLLVSGYLERISDGYCVIDDVIRTCINFYLIPNLTNYSNMLSFSQRDYPYSNALKLDVYNFENSTSYSLNIQGLNSDGTHYMYLVRNISLPRWIKDDIVDLGMFYYKI